MAPVALEDSQADLARDDVAAGLPRHFPSAHRRVRALELALRSDLALVGQREHIFWLKPLVLPEELVETPPVLTTLTTVAAENRDGLSLLDLLHTKEMLRPEARWSPHLARTEHVPLPEPHPVRDEAGIVDFTEHSETLIGGDDRSCRKHRGRVAQLCPA